jgi:hypothetical protein
MAHNMRDEIIGTKSLVLVVIEDFDVVSGENENKIEKLNKIINNSFNLFNISVICINLRDTDSFISDELARFLHNSNNINDLDSIINICIASLSDKLEQVYRIVELIGKLSEAPSSSIYSLGLSSLNVMILEDLIYLKTFYL